QRVARDTFRQPGPFSFHGIGLSSAPLAVRRQQLVSGVGSQERDAGNQRCPQQIPRDVRQNLLSPGAAPERQDIVHSPTPRIARLTRFRISGILYALNRSGCAPRTASSPASAAVFSSAQGLPLTSASTLSSR